MVFTTEKYEASVITNFEIFGCYFVDLFYNRIYMIAKRQKTEHSTFADEGLTAIYRRGVIDYVRSIRSVKRGGQFLKDTVMQLMNTYQKYANYNAITLIELQDIFLRNFMPKDHFVTLGATEKNFMLNKIIVLIVEQFAKEVVQTDFLCMVIDNHKIQKNTREWQNKILEIQINIREDLFSKLARKELNIDTSGGYKNNKGNVDELEYERLKGECQRMKKALDAAKDTIKKMLKEKCELEVKLDRARGVSQKIYGELMSTNKSNLDNQAAKSSYGTTDDNSIAEVAAKGRPQKESPTFGVITAKLESPTKNVVFEEENINNNINNNQNLHKKSEEIKEEINKKNDFNFENLMELDPLFTKSEERKVEEINNSSLEIEDVYDDRQATVSRFTGDDDEDDDEKIEDKDEDPISAARAKMMQKFKKV
jgi:hypothetical protein